MSTQKGNIGRSRSQKHNNVTEFKNSLHGVKNFNGTEVKSVCQRCKDIINWKIKYNKYKPLTMTKRCTKCQEKTITQAYHIMCKTCSVNTGLCAKCGKEESLERPSSSRAEIISQESSFAAELKELPERKRRTLLRYINSGINSGKTEENGKHMTKDCVKTLQDSMEQLEFDDELNT